MRLVEDWVVLLLDSDGVSAVDDTVVVGGTWFVSIRVAIVIDEFSQCLDGFLLFAMTNCMIYCENR